MSVKSLEQEIKNLKNIIEKKDIEILKLKNTFISNLNKEQNQNNSKIRTLSKELLNFSNISKESNFKDNKIYSIKQKLKNKKNHIKLLKTENYQFKREIIDYQNEIENLTSKINELEIKNIKLKNTKANFENLSLHKDIRISNIINEKMDLEFKKSQELVEIIEVYKNKLEYYENIIFQRDIEIDKINKSRNNLIIQLNNLITK